MVRMVAQFCNSARFEESMRYYRLGKVSLYFCWCGLNATSSTTSHRVLSQHGTGLAVSLGTVSEVMLNVAIINIKHRDSKMAAALKHIFGTTSRRNLAWGVPPSGPLLRCLLLLAFDSKKYFYFSRAARIFFFGKQNG